MCFQSESAKAVFSISLSLDSSDSSIVFTLQAGVFFGGVNPSSIVLPFVRNAVS
jgi:hypothetical protein